MKVNYHLFLYYRFGLKEDILGMLWTISIGAIINRTRPAIVIGSNALVIVSK